MTKRKKYTVFTIILIGYLSYSYLTSFPHSFHKIKVGQSKKQVIQILGTPKTKNYLNEEYENVKGFEEIEEVYYWNKEVKKLTFITRFPFYDIEKIHYYIFFKRERVTGKEKHNIEFIY